ncbi:T6SS effector BTH_I2691 family protein [Burkholderia ubonensis]|uniref:T6SS effector BTH_I2691 family protein n=1 Tax=Burkholderia ubonensis TaxID=101571 RepID=UPI000AE0B883
MTLPPCPYCEKEGLPILLTRYGIAPEKAFMARPGKPPVTRPAPKAASSVGDPTPAIALGESTDAHYTVRSLRGGYVYVYYEVGKSWEAYAVDQEGRLAQVPVESYMPPEARPFHQGCVQNMQKVASASLITIRDPKTAGKVWFGFSDAWWTPAVRKDNESEGIRRLHMRCVDVQRWYNDGQPAKAPPHASAVANVDAVVADYAMSDEDSRRLFFWSPFPALKQRSLQLPRATILKAESQRLLKDKGLIVVLDDPVAILQEISAYIDKRWSSFVSQNDAEDPVHPDQTWHRKSALSSSLETLRLRVEREAEVSVYGEARQARRNVEWIDGGDGKRVYNTGLLVPEYRKAAQPILDEKVTQAQLEAARAERWGAYEKLFDRTQREAFEARFEKASARHDAAYTTPLAIAHAAWLRSAKLRAVLDHHFDMRDINSGAAFAGMTLSCIRGTGGLGACMNVYSDWFDESIEKSPLWRALNLNHRPLLQAVDEVSSGSGEPFGNPDDWINLFVVYSAAASKIRERGAAIGALGVKRNTVMSSDVLPALLQELGVLPTNILRKGGKSGTALRATLGMRSGHSIRVVEVAATRRDLYKTILEVILKSQAGRGISLGHLQYSLADQLRTFEIEGVPLDEKVRFWSLVFDEEAQTSLANGRVTPAQRGDALGKTVKVIGVEKFAEGTVGKVIESAAHPGVLAGVGLTLAVVGLTQAASADASMKHLGTRATLKIAALYSAGAGSLLDLVRVGARALAGRRVPMLSPWLGARLGQKGFLIWEGLGGVAGGVGTIMLGTIDIRNAVEALRRDQKGLMALYIVNAGAELYVGFRTAIAGGRFIFRLGTLVAGFNPVVFGLTVVILVASVVIEIEKDPPTMDWVRQCLWGEESNYRDAAEEMDNFNKALKG